MGAVPWSLARRAVASYVLRRPWCASFELTHNCNARCHHCHRGERVTESLATPQRLLEICRELRPLVAILSGGEPLLRPDLLEIVRTLKGGCAPLRVFVNTNGALLTLPRFADLVDAGVDEVLVSLDYPDERHDAFRAIPGLFGRIRALVAALPPRERRRVVLTTVLHAENFREALTIARLALEWGVNVNFSAYTSLRTNDLGLMIAGPDVAAFARGGRETSSPSSGRTATSSPPTGCCAGWCASSRTREASGAAARANGWSSSTRTARSRPAASSSARTPPTRS